MFSDPMYCNYHCYLDKFCGNPFDPLLLSERLVSRHDIEVALNLPPSVVNSFYCYLLAKNSIINSENHLETHILQKLVDKIFEFPKYGHLSDICEDCNDLKVQIALEFNKQGLSNIFELANKTLSLISNLTSGKMDETPSNNSRNPEIGSSASFLENGGAQKVLGTQNVERLLQTSDQKVNHELSSPQNSVTNFRSILGPSNTKISKDIDTGQAAPDTWLEQTSFRDSCRIKNVGFSDAIQHRGNYFSVDVVNDRESKDSQEIPDHIRQMEHKQMVGPKSVLNGVVPNPDNSVLHGKPNRPEFVPINSQCNVAGSESQINGILIPCSCRVIDRRTKTMRWDSIYLLENAFFSIYDLNLLKNMIVGRDIYTSFVKQSKWQYVALLDAFTQKITFFSLYAPVIHAVTDYLETIDLEAIFDTNNPNMNTHLDFLELTLSFVSSFFEQFRKMGDLNEAVQRIDLWLAMSTYLDTNSLYEKLTTIFAINREGPKYPLNSHIASPGLVDMDVNESSEPFQMLKVISKIGIDLNGMKCDQGAVNRLLIPLRKFYQEIYNLMIDSETPTLDVLIMFQYLVSTLILTEGLPSIIIMIDILFSERRFMISESYFSEIICMIIKNVDTRRDPYVSRFVLECILGKYSITDFSDAERTRILQTIHIFSAGLSDEERVSLARRAYSKIELAVRITANQSHKPKTNHDRNNLQGIDREQAKNSELGISRNGAISCAKRNKNGGKGDRNVSKIGSGQPSALEIESAELEAQNINRMKLLNVILEYLSYITNSFFHIEIQNIFIECVIYKETLPHFANFMCMNNCVIPWISCQKIRDPGVIVEFYRTFFRKIQINYERNVQFLQKVAKKREEESLRGFDAVNQGIQKYEVPWIYLDLSEVFTYFLFLPICQPSQRTTNDAFIFFMQILRIATLGSVEKTHLSRNFINKQNQHACFCSSPFKRITTDTEPPQTNHNGSRSSQMFINTHLEAVRNQIVKTFNPEIFAQILLRITAEPGSDIWNDICENLNPIKADIRVYSSEAISNCVSHLLKFVVAGKYPNFLFDARKSTQAAQISNLKLFSHVENFNICSEYCECKMPSPISTNVQKFTEVGPERGKTEIISPNNPYNRHRVQETAPGAEIITDREPKKPLSVVDISAVARKDDILSDASNETSCNSGGLLGAVTKETMLTNILERHVIDFCEFLLHQFRIEFWPVLNMVPRLPCKKEYFYIYFQIWVYLLRNNLYHQSTFFCLKTPALIDFCSYTTDQIAVDKGMYYELIRYLDYHCEKIHKGLAVIRERQRNTNMVLSQSLHIVDELFLCQKCIKGANLLCIENLSAVDMLDISDFMVRTLKALENPSRKTKSQHSSPADKCNDSSPSSPENVEHINSPTSRLDHLKNTSSTSLIFNYPKAEKSAHFTCISCLRPNIVISEVESSALDWELYDERTKYRGKDYEASDVQRYKEFRRIITPGNIKKIFQSQIQLIILYSEIHKVNNFNFSGILEYIQDPALIGDPSIHLSDILRIIHFSVKNTGDYFKRYILELLRLYPNAFETTKKLILLIIQCLMTEDPTSAYDIEIHLVMNNLIRFEASSEAILIDDQIFTDLKTKYKHYFLDFTQNNAPLLYEYLIYHVCDLSLMDCIYVQYQGKFKEKVSKSAEIFCAIHHITDILRFPTQIFSESTCPHFGLLSPLTAKNFDLIFEKSLLKPESISQKLRQGCISTNHTVSDDAPGSKFAVSRSQPPDFQKVDISNSSAKETAPNFCNEAQFGEYMRSAVLAMRTKNEDFDFPSTQTTRLSPGRTFDEKSNPLTLFTAEYVQRVTRIVCEEMFDPYFDAEFLVDAFLINRNAIETRFAILYFLMKRLEKFFNYHDLHILVRIYDILDIKDLKYSKLISESLSKGLDFRSKLVDPVSLPVYRSLGLYSHFELCSEHFERLKSFYIQCHTTKSRSKSSILTKRRRRSFYQPLGICDLEIASQGSVSKDRNNLNRADSVFQKGVTPLRTTDESFEIPSTADCASNISGSSKELDPSQKPYVFRFDFSLGPVSAEMDAHFFGIDNSDNEDPKCLYCHTPPTHMNRCLNKQIRYFGDTRSTKVLLIFKNIKVKPTMDQTNSNNSGNTGNRTNRNANIAKSYKHCTLGGQIGTFIDMSNRSGLTLSDLEGIGTYSSGFFKFYFKNLFCVISGNHDHKLKIPTKPSLYNDMTGSHLIKIHNIFYTRFTGELVRARCTKFVEYLGFFIDKNHLTVIDIVILLQTSKCKQVRKCALDSLKDKDFLFYVPQIVQCLVIQEILSEASVILLDLCTSKSLSHSLIWALRAYKNLNKTAFQKLIRDLENSGIFNDLREMDELRKNHEKRPPKIRSSQGYQAESTPIKNRDDVHRSKDASKFQRSRTNPAQPDDKNVNQVDSTPVQGRFIKDDVSRRSFQHDSEYLPLNESKPRGPEQIEINVPITPEQGIEDTSTQILRKTSTLPHTREDRDVRFERFKLSCSEERGDFMSTIKFFDSLTEISALMIEFRALSKESRTAKINNLLSKIRVEGLVYLPIEPEYEIISIVPNSARSLQSYAKVPYMVSFYCISNSNLSSFQYLRKLRKFSAKLSEIRGSFGQDSLRREDRHADQFSVKGPLNPDIFEPAHQSDIENSHQDGRNLKDGLDNMPLGTETDCFREDPRNHNVSFQNKHQPAILSEDQSVAHPKISTQHNELAPPLVKEHQPTSIVRYHESIQTGNSIEPHSEDRSPNPSEIARNSFQVCSPNRCFKNMVPGLVSPVKITQHPVSGDKSEEEFSASLRNEEVSTDSRTVHRNTVGTLIEEHEAVDSCSADDADSTEIDICSKMQGIKMLRKILSSERCGDDFYKTFDISEKRLIIKAGDDCRQDMLVLQLIEMFRTIFQDCNLDLFLCPYKVIATSDSTGIIEIVPNARTRDEIGKERMIDMSEYFRYLYGYRETKRHKQALYNFTRSFAGYGLVVYFLNIKDRHNANVMITDEAYIVHIDFGFLFESNPRVNTEHPIKLTNDIYNLLIENGMFDYFQDIVIKGFLALRRNSKEIIFLVDSFKNSGLPCFSPNTVKNLITRFRLDLSDSDAREYIISVIKKGIHGIGNWFYDKYQNILNDIAH